LLEAIDEALRSDLLSDLEVAQRRASIDVEAEIAFVDTDGDITTLTRVGGVVRVIVAEKPDQDGVFTSFQKASGKLLWKNNDKYECTVPEDNINDLSAFLGPKGERSTDSVFDEATKIKVGEVKTRYDERKAETEKALAGLS
jgi:hypothetical protein